MFGDGTVSAQLALYALLSGPCQGKDCDKIPAEYQRQSGLLLYSSLADCQAEVDEFKKMFGGDLILDGKKIDAHMESYCATIYFADYAQTERMDYGIRPIIPLGVQCTFQTYVPESMMARTLVPYPDSAHCVEPKKKTIK